LFLCYCANRLDFQQNSRGHPDTIGISSTNFNKDREAVSFLKLPTLYLSSLQLSFYSCSDFLKRIRLFNV
jgi:hypothetical protein